MRACAPSSYGVVCSDRIRERECLKLGLAAAARCMLHHAQNEMVVAHFIRVAHWERLESPMITWRRR